MDTKNTPNKIVIVMTRILLCTFICLISCCQKTKISTINDDAIVAEWNLAQMEAADQLAYDKYCFNYEEYTPYEIIQAQENELLTYYHRGKVLPTEESKVTAWTEKQKKALSILDPKNKMIQEKIDIQQLSHVRRLLKEEKACLDKIEWSNKTKE